MKANKQIDDPAELPNGTYFITGIDTDAGKSYATAVIAQRIAQTGRRVITQKMVQTGCVGISEDIETHRRVMGIPLQELDLDGTTCTEIFKFAASPHLAARLENRTIDLDRITAATHRLETLYDTVLIEGAGGLIVPLTDDYTTADYIVERQLPVMIVTSPRLGSINHTLLTLEACRTRSITVAALIYNHYPLTDKIIETETFDYLCRQINKHHPNTKIYEIEILA